MRLTHFLLPLALVTLAAAAPTPATSDLSQRSQSVDPETVKLNELARLLSRDDVVARSFSDQDLDLNLLGKRAPLSKPALGVVVGQGSIFKHIIKKVIYRNVFKKKPKAITKKRDLDELEEQFQLFIRELENKTPAPLVARSHPNLDLLGF